MTFCIANAFSGVATNVSNQAVKRNIACFPENFRFRLDHGEFAELVTSCDGFEIESSILANLR